MGVLLVVIVVHRWVPDVRWLMVHLVTLGVVTNSIVVWSQHFTESLLKNRLPDEARGRQLTRIRVLNAGIVASIAGLLSTWFWLTVLAAALIGAALTWHGTALLGQLRAALPSRFAVTVRFYVVAAFLLPAGAVLGAVLAAGMSEPWHARVLLAHEATNVLGFVGLTVTGTLLTLWPTILRTRMVEISARITTVALPVMTGGIVVTVGGSLFGSVWVTVVGLAAYACGLAAVVLVMVRTAVGRRPADYAGFSMAAGVAWWLATTVAIVWLVGVGGFDTAVLRQLTVPFVAGFLAQVLLGAMTYLLPVTMGGGPATVRAANRVFNRAATFRVVVINLCVLLFSLPPGLLPSWVRAAVSVLGAAASFAFLPLMVSAAKVSVAGRKAAAARPAQTGAPMPSLPPLTGDVPPSRHARGAVGGILTVALGVVVGIALNPAAAGFDLRAQHTGPAQATGNTMTAQVSAEEDMRSEPASVEVPVGDELVIELTNNDPTNVHDLVLSSGAGSSPVAHGQTVTVVAGVIGESVEGWCSIVGHKTMGMEFDVIAVGADGAAVDAAPVAAREAAGHTGMHGAAAEPAADPAGSVDFDAAPGDRFDTRSPVLDPVDGELEDGRRVHRVELDVEEMTQEIAPEVQLQAWTYNGRYMGPTLHGQVGDVFEITLVNDGSMGHSVDFHAGAVAPDGPMRTIAPGESLVYRFEALRSGIWLYHCSTAPMSTHLAAGMFGAVVIDPPGLPAVDREYLLVQGETYLSPAGNTADGEANAVVAPEKVVHGVPSLTMFNGHATQYVHDPLSTKTGERVRIWVLAAGPSKGVSFHVVGGQFDTVYKEGAYLLSPGGTGRGGAQALDLAPAQGGFVELEFSEPGPTRSSITSWPRPDAGLGA